MVMVSGGELLVVKSETDVVPVSAPMDIGKKCEC